jgi:hypothetical protein
MMLLEQDQCSNISTPPLLAAFLELVHDTPVGLCHRWIKRTCVPMIGPDKYRENGKRRGPAIPVE